MPIFHLQVQGQQKATDGTLTLVPPATGLRMVGPVIQVSLTIEDNAGKGLMSQGKALPTPVTGVGLIDTGATGTCIDDDVAKKLGLPVIDVGKMSSATHPDEPCNIYPVKIQLPTFAVNVTRAMGAKLASIGLVALIGRDILEKCTFYYNGPSGQITLSI